MNMPGMSAALERILHSERKMQLLKHLAKVKEDYNQNIASKFDVSPGSYFVHIQRLEKYKLIEGVTKENKRDIYYHLTDLGKWLVKQANSGGTDE